MQKLPEPKAYTPLQRCCKIIPSLTSWQSGAQLEWGQKSSNRFAGAKNGAESLGEILSLCRERLGPDSIGV